MKVLIFSASTGQGHNASSQAMKDALSRRDPSIATKIIDISDAKSPAKSSSHRKSQQVSHFYDWTAAHIPAFYGFGYHLAERLSSPRQHSPIYWINGRHLAPLSRLIAREQPDVIVCPHMFSALAIEHLRQQGLSVPTIGLITDYMWSPYWEESRLDAYIVASTEVKDECTAHGIPPDRIFPIGIPVSPALRLPADKVALRRQLGLTQPHVLLLMGGSMGYGNLYALAKALSSQLTETDLLVVCGHNAELYHQVVQLKGVHAYGYTRHLPDLMRAADLLVTKPGGLTATEAMTLRLPILFIKGIPNGEAQNAAAISRLGLAAVSRNVAQTVTLSHELLGDPRRARDMRDAQARYIDPEAADKVAAFIIRRGSEGASAHAD